MKLPISDQPDKKSTKRPKRARANPWSWQRFSNNHEFPLSVVSSVFLHIVGYGSIALILTGAFLSLFGIHEGPLPVESIEIAGGGGLEQGFGTGPAEGAIPSGPESLKPNTTTDKPDLAQRPPAQPQPLLDPSLIKDPSRPLEENPPSGSEPPAGLDDRARERIRDMIAGKGKGGRGSGGGEGRGRGVGIGNEFGPGVSNGPLTLRQKRRMRWALRFDTQNGQDYLRQLNGLGAILAVPTADGQHRVYRDLANPPLQGRSEDLSSFNQMYWYDEAPKSVRTLSIAMGLAEIPDSIIAFFPPEVEKTLLQKEHRRYSGNEDDIRETVFKIVRRGGRYEPEVESLDTVRPR